MSHTETKQKDSNSSVEATIRLYAKVIYFPKVGYGEGHVDVVMSAGDPENPPIIFARDRFKTCPKDAIEIKLPPVSMLKNKFVTRYLQWKPAKEKDFLNWLLPWKLSKEGDYSLFSNNCAHSTLRTLRIFGFTDRDFDSAFLITPEFAAQEACRMGQQLSQTSPSKALSSNDEYKKVYLALKKFKSQSWKLFESFLSLRRIERKITRNNTCSSEEKDEYNKALKNYNSLIEPVNQAYSDYCKKKHILTVGLQEKIEKIGSDFNSALKENDTGKFLTSLLGFENYFQQLFPDEQPDNAYDSSEVLNQKIQRINQLRVPYSQVAVSTLFVGGGVLLHYYACMHQWAVLGVCVGAMGGPIGLAVTIGAMLAALLVLTCGYCLFKAFQSQSDQQLTRAALTQYILPVTFFSSGVAMSICCVSTVFLASTSVGAVLGGPVGLVIGAILGFAFAYYLCLKKSRAELKKQFAQKNSLFQPPENTSLFPDSGPGPASIELSGPRERVPLVA